MRTIVGFILVILLLIFIAILGYWAFGGDLTPLKELGNPASAGEAISPADLDLPLDANYQNEKYKFSFKYPATFKTSFIENVDGKDLLVVQSPDSKIGFQIEIQSIDEDIDVLTVERIRQDLPDILIENPQDVILGSGKGVAFISDDPAFNGRSREVWFVFNKTLYQIRTYASQDPLMQKILGTWEFN